MTKKQKQEKVENFIKCFVNPDHLGNQHIFFKQQTRNYMEFECEYLTNFSLQLLRGVDYLIEPTDEGKILLSIG